MRCLPAVEGGTGFIVRAYHCVSQDFTIFHPEPGSVSWHLTFFHMVSIELSDIITGLWATIGQLTRAELFPQEEGMAVNASGATIAPTRRIEFSRCIERCTNVYGELSLADAEESGDRQAEQEGERQFGLPAFHPSRLVGKRRSAPVAPETRELLAALILNVAACQRWLSAEPPDIRQACATIERVTSLANALSELICVPPDC
ncbi:MAG TPA: hypothetical protein VMB73_21710 [Acetobacteraceae bacterium]|nr:hypothetical protein [Acetobacteraceae bacterium]